jgi:hypothetical protein
MDVQYFHSESPILWQWPLKVSFGPGTTTLRNKLLSGHWSQQFTRTNQQANQPSNILFLTAAALRNRKFLESTDASADVLFVLLSPKTEVPDGFDPLAMAKGLRANGVLVTMVPSDPQSWFNEFIVSLSHNEHILQALDRIVNDGVFYCDAKVIEQTTLSYVINTLIEGLKLPPLSNKFYQLDRADKTMSGSSISYLLDQARKNYKFDSETLAASDVHAYSTAVFEQSAAELFASIHGTMPFGGTENYSLEDVQASDETIEESDANDEEFSRPSAASNDSGQSGGSERSSSQGSGDYDSWFAEGRRPTFRSMPMEPPETASASEPSDEDEDTARYLQAQVITKEKTVTKEPLEPDVNYMLAVRIGIDDPKFTRGESSIDTATIFKGSVQPAEKLQLKFIPDDDTDPQFAEISLPRKGNSDIAMFAFTPAKNSASFQANIYAYHRNRLIQQIVFTAPVAGGQSKDTAHSIKVVFCTRKSLGAIGERTNFSSTLQLEAAGDTNERLQGVTNNKPVDLYFDGGLKTHLADIKTEIQTALGDEEAHPADLFATGNQDLLVFLASKGSLIFTNFLRGAVAPEGPIQIVTNYAEYLPIEFVYSMPPPDENATVCPRAAESLRNGKCCGDGGAMSDPASHVCPFGFWAFSRVIERHSYNTKNKNSADYCIVSEPADSRNTLGILGTAMYGSSARVDNSGAGLRKTIFESIQSYADRVQEVLSWESWKDTATTLKPDSLILVVHVERDKRFKMDKLEIGDKDFVLQTHIGSKIILKENLKPPPFVIVLGCETKNISSEGFDVSSHFLNVGAAIVLSNFTKIQGKHAKEIVTNLLQSISAYGQSPVLFGDAVLQLRRRLLADGHIAALSLVAQGDADWKIKS